MSLRNKANRLEELFLRLVDKKQEGTVMNIALNLVAVKTIIRKEMSRVLRIWVQTIVPPAITMTLYFIIFGNLIGRRIGRWTVSITCSTSRRV